MLRRLLAAFSRYRPRVLTLVVLMAISGLLVLANSIGVSTARSISSQTYPPAASELQFEVGKPAPSGSSFLNLSYGWPIVWRQYVIFAWMPAVLGENYSAARLAANLVIWLLLLAAPAVACEWLLRRYRPRWRFRLRLRFSLRTLLVATGLAAAFCAWFAPARNRANSQDPLIAAVNGHGGSLWGERWGPKWLDRYGADRFCRRIFGAEIAVRRVNDAKDRQELLQLLDGLSRASDLQYLHLKADQLSPELMAALAKLRRLETLQIEAEGLAPGADRGLADALVGMQRLRILSISGSYRLLNEPPSEWLTAVGRLSQLEHLRLRNWMVASEDLAPLTGLTKLKSLTLERLCVDPKSPEWDLPLLARLSPLVQLEVLDLKGSAVDDRDLQHIARQPRLKSLNLSGIYLTGRALADLAPLVALEELAVRFYPPVWEGWEAVVKLKGLKKLHIDDYNEEAWRSRDAMRGELPFGVLEHEIEDNLKAYNALRKTNPGLVIDDDDEPLRTFESRLAPQGELTRNLVHNSSDSDRYSRAVQAWKDKQAGKTAGVVNSPATK